MLDEHDHRTLAQRLDLLHFQDDAPGMVFWHPNGLVVYRLLEDTARRRVQADGYLEVRSPQILRRSIWDASGHWQHFADGMFRVDERGVEAAAKPVSCPCHIELTKRMSPSYRDLPLRFAEMGIVHRAEPGGTLHGLFRLRQFTQDDGHVFCRDDQIEEELDRFCRSVVPFYESFGLPRPAAALSTRPENRGGDEDDWDRAEHALRRSLERLGIAFGLQPGAGAFYGPKIEFSLPDRSGRPWQCATVQLDAVMPRRFGLRYQDAAGDRRPLVLIHRALYGSLERFAGLLLEHHRGRLPAWLAPVQVRVLPVETASRDSGETLRQRLQDAGLRAEVDVRDDSLSKRVKAAHDAGAVVIAIVGERERRSETVTLRGAERGETLPIAEAVDRISRHCEPPASHP